MITRRIGNTFVQMTELQELAFEQQIDMNMAKLGFGIGPDGAWRKRIGGEYKGEHAGAWTLDKAQWAAWEVIK